MYRRGVDGSLCEPTGGVVDSCFSQFLFSMAAGAVSLMALGIAVPAAAQTTHGGLGGAFITGTRGAGGASNPTGAGGTGGNGTILNGAGGGGAGASGGNGGHLSHSGNVGGAGGLTPGAAGGTSTGTFPYGGGGGGGAHGVVMSAGGTVGSSISGGAGGKGGDGGETSSTVTAGGGGGAGGYGAVANGAGIAITNSSTITGGAGGNGGTAVPLSGISNLVFGGGGGGDGGFGVLFTGAGTLNNAGTIVGGNGGTGGSGFRSVSGVAIVDPVLRGADGVGGIGVAGSNLNIVNSGTIMGGLSGDGVTRANAIQFFGGTNSLTLAPGSNIVGNVVAFSAADMLALGGSGTSSFDASLIGTQYQGFGLFQKTGDSTWTLAGNNSAAMPWTLNGGTLNVTGALANASMLVNSGATLAGTGTVGATQINTGGIFAPGNGTAGSSMTVSGNLTFQPGATYLVQTAVQTASFANVTGAATLGGDVQASFAPGSYLKKTYTILSSAGLNGTRFSSLGTTDLPSGFTASLGYTGTNVLLNLDAQYSGGPGACGSANACGVASSIKGFFDNGGALPPQFQQLFGLTGGALPASLSLLSGEVATGTQGAVFRLGDQFLNVMLDAFVGVQFGRFDRFGMGSGRMSIAPDRRTEMQAEIAQVHGEIFHAPGSSETSPADRPWTVWGTVYGGGNRTVGDVAGSGTHDVTAATGGIAVGADYRVTADTVAGFAIGMGTTGWNVSDGQGNGSSKAVNVGLYGATHFGPAYLATAFAFSNHWVTTDRYAFMGDHLGADFNVINFGGRVEGGYRFDVTPGIGVIPYAAVQVQALRMPGFTENDTSGVGFGLSYAAADATDTRGELGARFQDLTEIGGVPVMLRARLAWAHDWASNPALTAAFQALPGSSFVVNGAAQPSDSALTSIGAEVWLNPSTSILAKFDGEFAGTAQTYGGSARLRYTF